MAIIFTNAQIRRYSLKIHLFLFWFLLGASVSGLQAQSIVPPKSEKALRRAESAYAQRDIESMKRHLDEAVETGPRHAEAFLFRADFRVQSGLAAEAIVLRTMEAAVGCHTHGLQERALHFGIKHELI